MSGGKVVRLTSTELHSLLAIAWEEGHRWCYDGGGEQENPYRSGNSSRGKGNQLATNSVSIVADHCGHVPEGGTDR